jgi:hypothetical protein
MIIDLKFSYSSASGGIDPDNAPRYRKQKQLILIQLTVDTAITAIAEKRSFNGTGTLFRRGCYDARWCPACEGPIHF